MLRELPVDESCTLRDLPFRALHSVYATWRGRVPAAMPRYVHLSVELLGNRERHVYADGLAAAVREIAEGASLRPRMSTAIDHAYALEPPPVLARRRSRHRDLLLADWAIHHMHLSTDPHPRRPRFLARTSQVLFAAFVGQNAYLIDLRPHESDGANWSELAILETAVRNWPDSGILLPSRFVVGLVGGNRSDEERRALRSAGISGGLVEVDGRVWMAGGGGQSLAGTPVSVEMHCMKVGWFLRGYKLTQSELRAELSGYASEGGVPDESWCAHVHGDHYGFISSGLFVPYGSLIP